MGRHDEHEEYRRNVSEKPRKIRVFSLYRGSVLVYSMGSERCTKMTSKRKSKEPKKEVKKQIDPRPKRSVGRPPQTCTKNRGHAPECSTVAVRH